MLFQGNYNIAMVLHDTFLCFLVLFGTFLYLLVFFVLKATTGYYRGLLSSSCGGLGAFGPKDDFTGRTNGQMDGRTMGLRELDVPTKSNKSYTPNFVLLHITLETETLNQN